MPRSVAKPKHFFSSMTFHITLSQSGHRFEVDDNETVLEAAIRQGIGLPYGCRNGQCGNCQGLIKSGTFNYKNPITALTPEQQANGLALLCQAYPTSDLEIDINELTHAKEVPTRCFPAKVAGINQISHDVLQIILSLPANFRLPFFAGQYINFILKDGRRRSFSIANAPNEDKHIELHVRHIKGGEFTGEVFDGMQVKDVVRIEGPLGSFFLREQSERTAILMAGGTGFAPVKGIVEHVLAKNLKRDLHIYWGARRFADLYFHEQAQRWSEEHENIHYTPVLSESDTSDNWSGRTGFVHNSVLQDFSNLNNVEVYASGPPVMVYAGRDAFVEQGMESSHYYSDAFEFADDKK